MATEKKTATVERNGAQDFDRLMEERDARKAAQSAEQQAKKRADMIKLNELELEHGDENVRAVFTLGGMVAIRRPKKHEIDRFFEDILKDGKAAHKAERQRRASERLAKIVRIYPSAEQYEAMCDLYGGIPQKVGSAASDFADASVDDEAGKA